jgi:hypothetical protein
MDKSARKLKEHYGIEVPMSAIRVMTLKHGEAMREGRDLGIENKLPDGGIGMALAQTDGSMVPIVTIKPLENDESPRDGRKRRSLSWQEGRLVLTRDIGKVTPRYAATMGTVEQTTELLVDSLVKIGAGKSTRVHGMGDGAVWIANRTMDKLKGQATFLLDFYHISEYIAAAAEVVAAGRKQGWLREQQQHLKDNQVSKLLNELERHCQFHDLAKCGRHHERNEREECPAHRCKRYIENRLDYLDYKGALEAGLPIGTGETEGGHRSIIQARIKKSGAWWLRESVDKILTLRTNRANREWEPYWANFRQRAA